MTETQGEVKIILSDEIALPVKQMRREIDRDELHVLSESIKEKGLISPITVRPIEKGYELVAGQRRLLACRIAGIIRIPCIVRELSESEALAIMAAENIERKDVNLVDEANFIKLAMDSGNLSIHQMAQQINRGVDYVINRLAIAEMPDYMQEFLRTGELKLGVALALMEIEPDDKRKLWVGLAIQDNVTVRTAEYWAYQHKLGTLPGAVEGDGDIPEAPDAPYKPAMLTCSVDGQQYIASECQAVFVYRGNLQFIDALRAEMGRPVLNESVAGGENPV